MPAPDYEDDLVFPPKDWTHLKCNHFVELTEKVKKLKAENDFLKNGSLYDFWETYKDNIATKEQTIKQLRGLLKECKPFLEKEMETIKGAGFCNCDWAWKTSDVLTRINEAING